MSLFKNIPEILPSDPSGTGPAGGLAVSISSGSFFYVNPKTNDWEQVTTGGQAGFSITWTAVTYANGWSDFGSGYQVGQYGTDGNGNVWVRGLMVAGTVTPGTTIFNIPAGLRPAHTQIYMIGYEANQSTLNPCQIDIDTTGDVVSQSLNIAPGNLIAMNLFFTTT